MGVVAVSAAAPIGVVDAEDERGRSEGLRGEGDSVLVRAAAGS